MVPDVEALLINRVGKKREYYIVPIDLCFELIGLIRVHWRGLSGGDKVWEEVETFFSKLKAGAREPNERRSVSGSGPAAAGSMRPNRVR